MHPETDSGEITLAEVRFFEAKRNAFPLYESLRTAILQNCGPTEIQVKKTQISFVNRHLFGAVSFTPVRRAKERPDPYKQPPWIYPVRGSSSLDLIMLILFSPTALAAFFRSSSWCTGIRKT